RPLVHSPLMTRRPPPASLLPYPTLFRSAFPARPESMGDRGGRTRHPARSRPPPARVVRPVCPVHALVAVIEASCDGGRICGRDRSEEHTSELQSRENLVCRLVLGKKKHR